MALPLIITAVGTGLKMGGDIYSTIQTRKDLKRQAANYDEQALLEEQASQFDALQMSRKFDELIGEQTLSIASSGSELEGSAMDILAQSDRDKMTSVNNILQAGRNKAGALRDTASQARKARSKVLVSGLLGASGGAANLATKPPYKGGA